LADEQLHYGVQDVTYLPALYKEQAAQLRKKGLEECAQDAFAKIAACTWQERTLNKRGYTKIAGYSFLDQQQKDILKKLYVWRFERAKEENRAIFMFLPDKTLTDLVQSGDHWRDFLPAEKVQLYGAELEEIIIGI
ncbi:MAG: HRDC domain-containing protein, partial [Smithellaceae bacterium]